MPDVFFHRYIQSYVHQGRMGVLVEFGHAARDLGQTPAFVALSKELAMHIAACSPASVEDLARQPYVRDPSLTVAGWLRESCDRLGASVEVTRFIRWGHEPDGAAPIDTPPDQAAVAQQRVNGQ